MLSVYEWIVSHGLSCTWSTYCLSLRRAKCYESSSSSASRALPTSCVPLRFDSRLPNNHRTSHIECDVWIELWSVMFVSLPTFQNSIKSFANKRSWLQSAISAPGLLQSLDWSKYSFDDILGKDLSTALCDFSHTGIFGVSCFSRTSKSNRRLLFILCVLLVSIRMDAVDSWKQCKRA